jgi:hypothetical protein
MHGGFHLKDLNFQKKKKEDEIKQEQEKSIASCRGKQNHFNYKNTHDNN